jgi:hypothetical protein
MIVYVMYSSNVVTYQQELARQWEAMPPEVAAKQVQLYAPRGQIIYPLTFAKVEGGGGAFQVTFPKQIDGKPVLTPQDKEMKIEFPHPDIGGQGASRVTVTFDLRKMTADGKILY